MCACVHAVCTCRHATCVPHTLAHMWGATHGDLTWPPAVQKVSKKNVVAIVGLTWSLRDRVWNLLVKEIPFK